MAALACDDDQPLATVEPPPDAGCASTEQLRSFAIYFVIDVSGSMAPFLRDLSNQVETLARGLPQLNDLDERVLVDYYVVAFVNDVKWFPSDEARRMTSPIAVQAAFATAIEAGLTNRNLEHGSINAEETENLLDALAEVVESQPTADRVLLVVATDASFAETPTVLSTNISVRSTYAGIKGELERLGLQVHAFTPDALDGLTRSYRDQPPLSTLPGSSAYSLRELTGAESLLSQTLADIARAASCN